jgi:hypothetical protein
MDSYDEQKASDAAWAFLRSNSTATLRFGENSQDISYIIAPDGRLVISSMVAMLQPCDTIMYVPEYAEDCMEMHVSLRQFLENGDDGTLADRWQVYHGEPPDVQWAIVDIDAARFHEMFIDGEALTRANSLAQDEVSLCKQLNKNKDKIRLVCSSKTNVEVSDPFVVGVDSLGIDVRAPFGIVRIQADTPFTSSSDVLALFNLK